MLGNHTISSLQELESVAQQFADYAPNNSWIFLQGDLGAGKTTFSQRFIYNKGYRGKVTSPTYALMQDYQTDTGCVIHCDLYRLSDPEELYEIGLIDLAEHENAIVLVEWPNKGQGVLPNPHFIIQLEIVDMSRQVRELIITQYEEQ